MSAAKRLSAKRLLLAAWLPLAAAGLACLPGCGSQGGPEMGKDQKKALPAVVVSRPVPANVTDYEEFTGRVEAANRVGVQAMVTGYLVKINFVDGKEVLTRVEWPWFTLIGTAVMLAVTAALRPAFPAPRA